MRPSLFAAFFFAFTAAAAAQTDLRCPEFTPRVRAVKTSRMQPLRRGKAWLAGTPSSAASDSAPGL